jgi:TusA-related sulfurtransferase
VPVDVEIDARSSFCPGPLMELIRGIREGEVGTTVAVLSRDPTSRSDIPTWVEKAAQQLVAVEEYPDYARYVVRKAR